MSFHFSLFRWGGPLLIICGLWNIHMGFAQSSISSASSSPSDSKALKKKAKDALLFNQIYKEGKQYFEQKEYTKAISKFLRAYRIRSNPNLVYNIARSFEELKEYADAAKYYEEYLKINPQASDRDDVELSIRTLKRLHDTKKEKTVSKSSSPLNSSSQSKESRSHSLSSTQRWEWGLLGGGFALIAGGLYFGLEASDFNHQLSQLKAGDLRQEYITLRTQRDDAAMLADAFWIPGLLVTGVGAYLLLTSPTKIESKTSSPSSRSSKEASLFQDSWQWLISPRHIGLRFSF